MKKSLILLAIVTLLLTIFVVGCNDDNSSKKNTQTQSTDTTSNTNTDENDDSTNTSDVNSDVSDTDQAIIICDGDECPNLPVSDQYLTGSTKPIWSEEGVALVFKESSEIDPYHPNGFASTSWLMATTEADGTGWRRQLTIYSEFQPAENTNYWYLIKNRAPAIMEELERIMDDCLDLEAELYSSRSWRLISKFNLFTTVGPCGEEDCPVVPVAAEYLKECTKPISWNDGAALVFCKATDSTPCGYISTSWNKAYTGVGDEIKWRRQAVIYSIFEPDQNTGYWGYIEDQTPEVIAELKRLKTVAPEPKEGQLYSTKCWQITGKINLWDE